MTADPSVRPSASREDETTHNGRQRHRSLWKDISWVLLSASALATVALGVTGFLKLFEPPAAAASPAAIAMDWIDAFYRTIQLFVLEFNPPENHVLPWELQVARFAAPIIAVFAAVQACLVIFADQVARLRLRFLRGHVIVCGIRQEGLFLVEALRRDGHKVVAIDGAGPGLASCRESGSFVLEGDATHPDVLSKAGVKRAGWLVALMGDGSANSEVAVQARTLVRRRPSSPLICVVQVNEPDLWILLRGEELRSRQPDDPVRIEFFNTFETAARVMLDHHPPFPDGLEPPADRPHLVLVGLGRMGRSVLIRAARDWRLRARGKGDKPLVTVLDPEANVEMDALLARYPDLAGTVEIDCVETEVGSPGLVQNLVRLSGLETMPVTAVYVCVEDDSVSLVAALAIQLHMRKEGRTVPIVARVSDERGLARLLSGGEEYALRGGGLHLFGLMNRTYSMALLTGGITESTARVLHAAYLQKEEFRATAGGDQPAHVPWEQLPERFREQNRHQAASMSRQIQGAGYRIVPLVDWDAWDFRFPEDVVERLARAEHDRWLRTAKRSGYRLGSVRNEHRKRTPSLVGWNELTEAEREKDRVFVRLWPETLFLAGVQIDTAEPDRPALSGP